MGEKLRESRMETLETVFECMSCRLIYAERRPRGSARSDELDDLPEHVESELYDEHIGGGEIVYAPASGARCTCGHPWFRMKRLY